MTTSFRPEFTPLNTCLAAFARLDWLIGDFAKELAIAFSARVREDYEVMEKMGKMLEKHQWCKGTQYAYGHSLCQECFMDEVGSHAPDCEIGQAVAAWRRRGV